ncbi:HNH endonuclease [Oceanobacillus kimchii]|uniref:HNH endonuclease n=1 Tax=Oceanobacillus kimchii TaxID=746691 RepID=UPI000344F7D7|nr:HNH endonuclease [Oceanobacillus kimchii]
MQPVPKPNHKRRKPKRGRLSKITPKVREEVKHRSGGQCERCGTYQSYAFEMAHLEQASQGGRGDEPWNVALLCGPSVNSGTCHHFADYTKDGREWRLSKRQELMEYYGVSSNN